MATSRQSWIGRGSAGVVGGAVSAALLAAAVVRWLPDPRPLERLYAGVLLAPAAWLALLLASWVAVSARAAWAMVLLVGALALAALLRAAGGAP